MKKIVFLGDSLEKIRDFPSDARQDIGYQLHRVQIGMLPDDWKPMPSIGKGVREIRTRTKEGAFRTIYVVPIRDTLFVLHAFQKKSQKTPKKDLETAAYRLKRLRTSS